MTVSALDDYIYWLWLSLAGGPANAGYSLLLEHFKDIKSVYSADLDAYSQVEGLEKRLAASLMNKDLTRASEIFEFCRTHSVRLLNCMEPDYPVKLKWIYAYPVLLYVYGTLPNLNETLTVGVVGTRTQTEYGSIAAYRIGGGLARARSIVISGMARGNDSVAQLAAINNGGKTIAVMGTGIDSIYPSEHRDLAKLISKNGALVTEFAPGTPPKRENFPMRNRIISGLSDAVALIEAPEKSGALITVRFALEQDRSVYAVPGDITSRNSAGPISLLKDGAKPITTAADIVEDFVCQYSYLNSVMKHTDLGVAVPKNISTVAYVTPEKKHKGRKEGKGAKLFESDTRYTHSSGLTRFIEKVTGSAKTDLETENEQTEQETATKTEYVPESRELPDGLSEIERELYSEIEKSGRANIEELTSMHTSAAEVLSALTKLEILGVVESRAGGTYTVSG